MRVFITSDFHFGHNNIAIKRGFADAKEQDALIVENWNKVVGKRDMVWILGDITMERSIQYRLLNEMRGMKKVILGNHDKPAHIEKLLQFVNSVSGPKKYKGFWLTHIPMHPQEMFGKKNIHGHTHEKYVEIMHPNGFYVQDERYLNASVDVNNYTPQLFDEFILK